jgi:hypothetical protein
MLLLKNNNLDACLDQIKEINEYKDTRIKALEDENKKLKDEHYKNEELQKLVEANKRLSDEMKYGFPITEEENEAITKWRTAHIKKKHWDSKNKCPKSQGAIGGGFTYEFIPTSIGVIGTIKCSCGESFCFCEMS